MRISNYQYDVIVIGAGVLGTFHAWFAAQRGMRVLLIEQDELPRGASVRNFGWCIPSAMPAGECADRGIAGLAIYLELAETIGIRLSRRGTQYVASTELEEAVIREFATGHSNGDLRCKLLDTKSSRALNPHLRREYCRVSLFFPDEVRIEPKTIFAKVIVWMERETDCDYRPRTVAYGVDVHDGHCRVATGDGRISRAGHVFVCSGVETRILFPDVWATAGLRRCQLQMLRTAAQTDWEMPTNLASGLSIRRYPSFRQCPSWAKLAEQSVAPGYDERGIHVLLPQDFSGRLVIGDSHCYFDGDIDDRLDAETERLILKYAQQMVDVPDWTIARRWQGVYTLLDDDDVFTSTIDYRIHLVTGIGGKGMTLAPALARESIDAIASTDPIPVT